MLFAALFVGIILVAGAGLFVYYAATAPELTEDDLIGTFSSEVLDQDGKVFYEFGSTHRDFASSNEIPEVLIDAILSIEDQRFYQHIGIDPIRIAGAVVANITDGFGSQGGSTITQQLVKLSVFSTKAEDQTLERKAQEAWLSVQLERQYSKEQILTLYINKIYMSENVYGMGTASEHYFGKPINDLELHEAALLAGMPQAPNGYNPYTNPERAKQRRDLVLRMMVDNEKITQTQADEAINVPITEGLVEQTSDQNNLVIDAYIKQVLKEVQDKTNLDPYTAGLTIQTNLDMDAQKHVYQTLNENESINFPDDKMQAGVSVLDVETGQIKALGGQRKQEGQLMQNWATENDRSIGSVMKPMSVYGPAIETLQYSTYHQVVDEPFTFPGTDWSPGNYDNQYKGQMSMRTALVDSRNIPTAKIFADVGVDKASDFLTKIGIDVDDLNQEPGLQPNNAINGKVTPMQVSASYASFANGGTYTEPYTVSKVVTSDGQEIDLRPSSNVAMSEATAYMVTDMLKDVASFYSSSVGIPGVPQAGKTGTTNYTKEQKSEHGIPSSGVPDSWYAGYTSNYSVSVWVGYPRQFENWLSFEDGTRHLPRHIYRHIMTHLSESVDNADWSRPSSVVEVAVEKGSNPAMLPGPNTPDNQIIRELFIKGTEPTEESTEFGEDLSAPSGLNAEYDVENDELHITWDEYSFENEEQNETIVYALNVNGSTYTSNTTEYSLSAPPEGEITISLSVRAFGVDGPESSITIQLEKPVEEEPDEEEKDSSKEDTTSPPPEEDENEVDEEEPDEQEPDENEDSAA